MSKQKIYFMVSGFPPIYSGAGNFIKRLAIELLKNGFQIEILSKNQKKKLISKRVDSNLNITSVGWISNNYIMVLYISIVNSLILLIGAKKRDILIICSLTREAILPVLIARVKGVKVILRQSLITNQYIQGDDFNALIKTRFGFLWVFLSKYVVARIVVISPALLNNNIEFGIPEEKFILIPNFPKPASNETNNKRSSDNSKSLQALYVGVICQRKGVDILLESWKRVQEVLPNANLVLVGPIVPPPPEVDRDLVAYANNMIKDGFRIKLAGSQNNVGEFYADSNLFLFPSRAEGLPNAVLGAMAYKLPIVITDIPGITDFMLDEKSGVIVEQNNVAAFADAIVSVFLEPDKMKRMASEALQRYRKIFNKDVITEKYIEMIRNIR